MMYRSIVTTDVAVCFTTLRLSVGVGLAHSECYGGKSPGIDFVRIRPVSASDGLPKITYRKAFSPSKLMDVAKLVQEERLVEALSGVQEDRSPERDTGDVRGAQHPAANT